MSLYINIYVIVQSMNDIKPDIVIIGGGPSGLMVAGTAIRKNPKSKIILIEKNNQFGKKLSITGGGRCNILNATFDTKELLSKYGPAEDFLYSTFSQFNVSDTIEFFKKLGLEIVIQENNRAFPKSEKALDVVKAMVDYATHPNITFLKNTRIKKINHNKREILSIETEAGQQIKALKYVFATGGLSHPETGSTGDGFDWLKDLGHTVKEATPTLVPWIVSDKWIHKNSGNSLNNLKISIFTDNKKFFDCKGRVLMTYRGLSGPTILNNSSKLQDALYHGKISANIDFYPYLNHKELDQLVLEIFDQNKNKKLKNILSKIFNLPNAEIILEKIKIDFEKETNLITKDERKSIVQLLKKLEINITGLEGYKKSIVADGGVSLKEINTKNMSSLKIKNLFITGDLLDIRRPSGGYSLQLCWTTGYVVGLNCVSN
jgi:predicted Rossmann fold flavoprotein